MKHPSSRALYALWDQCRGMERAPSRADLAPERMRDLLGDVFVLSADTGAGYPMRVAGTRISALLGSGLKGTRLLALFDAASRPDLKGILEEVTEELLVAVVGISATTSEQETIALEMLLLPFRSRAETPRSLTGSLLPMVRITSPVLHLKLTTWRYIHHARPSLAARALRKMALARGLTIYEGLRD